MNACCPPKPRRSKRSQRPVQSAYRASSRMAAPTVARMHAVTSPRFGWHRDNTIGATPQTNGWSDDWATFFRERRLRPQLELAVRNGHERSLLRDASRLVERIPAMLSGHHPAASLLHGDLWAGNAGRLRDGTPVVYDPSTYYGDRETDIAMTALFGGFDAAFYDAYSALMPFAPGHEKRRTLYNLYHVLNHVNLFGASYLPLARRMIAQLLG
jgi:protein-ribulosamine 3-kinase